MSSSNTRKIPFQGLKLYQWWRLGIIYILVTYIFILGGNVRILGLFNYVGLDFRTFYASAQITQAENYTQIYELETQKNYQLPLYENYRTSRDVPPFLVVPTPYFPVFILPFLFFILFSPTIAFTLFVLLNLVVFLLYAYRLVLKFNLKEDAKWVILGALASLPTFFNIFYGQVNLILFIALGEFFISIEREDGFRAGLWLSLWMVKPQALLFILPWLLFSRKWRALIGFSTGTVLIYVVSSFLAGWDWGTTWLELIILYPQNLPTTNPMAMMNWRGLAENLTTFFPQFGAWVIAWVGILFTSFCAVLTWRKNASSKQFRLAFLGTIAATCAITWHAHIHMGMILLIPLLALLGSKQLSYNLWAGIILTQFLGLAISVFGNIWFPSNNFSSVVILGVNVFFVYWSYLHFQRQQFGASHLR